MSDVFKTLAAVDCSAHTEKKGNFTYLSWTWAWSLVKSHYPTATFEKVVFHDNQNNPLPFMRDTKGNTYVQTTVTIEGESHSEIYPVLDFKNKAMPFPTVLRSTPHFNVVWLRQLLISALGLTSMLERTCQSWILKSPRKSGKQT